MNPIVARELLELLRTRKAVAAQAGLALACGLLVLIRWPSDAVGDLTGARSLQVLRVFGYGLLAGVLFLVPAFPATAIVREKVRGTLALLLVSPMSAPAIYFGKLGGVIGFTSLLLLATLPAAAACYALGGTSTSGGVGLLYVVLAAVTLQVSTLGLFVSGRAQSIDGALRTTYGLVLALCTLPMIPHLLLQGDTGFVAAAADWLRCLSPVPAVMELLGHAGVGTHGLGSSSAVPRYLLLSVMLSVICAAATIYRLISAPLDRARPAGVMTEDRSRGGRAARRVFFLVDPQRRSKGIGWWANPVMVKEFRTRRFGRSHWTIRLLLLSAVLSLALSYIAAAGALGWGVEVIGGGLVILQMALVVLFAPSLAAGLISAEREGGGWQLLRTTPLSPIRILFGKLLSAAWPLTLLLASTLPGYIVMTTVKPELADQVQRVVICLVTTAGFAILVSATASSLFRSTATATAVANAVLVVLCVGPLLVWLGRDAPFGHRTVEAALTLSPVAAALHASDTPGFANYHLLPMNWYLLGGISVALLVVLIVRVRQLCRPD